MTNSARAVFPRFLLIILALLLSLSGTGLAEDAQAETAEAAENTETVFVVADADQLENISVLVWATRMGVIPVERENYTPDMLAGQKFVITTVPQVARDAMASGILPVLLGEAASEADAVVTRLTRVGVSLSLDNRSEQFRFQEEIPVITSGVGETFGELIMANGKQYPFALMGENAWCVPWYDTDTYSYIALGELLWKYIGRESAGDMFVLIDEFYPFSDFDAMRTAVDTLYDNGIPFILRVMPVYENLDYPAFTRYMDALLYAQSKNGCIVVHSPIVESNTIDVQNQEEELGKFYRAMDEASVRYYPMIYSPFMMPVSLLYSLDCETKAFGTLNMDTMLVLDITDPEVFQEQLDVINDRWLTLENYALRYSYKRYVYRRRQPVSDFEYIPVTSSEASMREFFSIGNSVLIVVVGVSIAVLAVLTIVGYRLYRRKYFR